MLTMDVSLFASIYFQLLFICFNCFLFATSAKRKAGKVYYDGHFQETLNECEGFSNDVLDLSGIKMTRTGASDTILSGPVNIRRTIGKNGNAEIVAKIYREFEVGLEFTYLMSGNLCEQLTDEYKLPWIELFNEMGIESCPIEARTYDLNDFQMDLSEAQEYMVHEYVGSYFVSISLEEPDDLLLVENKEISCHGMTFSLLELYESDDEE